MKRYIILPIFALVVFVSAISEIDPVFKKVSNDLKSMELHGKVRKVTEITIVGKVIGRKDQAGDTLYKYIYSFNDYGYLINTISYDNNIKLNWRSIYEYDSNGFKTVVIQYKLDSTLHSKHFFVYHTDDTCIEERTYDSTGKFACKNFTYYDSIGNVKKSQFYFMSLLDPYIYNYSDSGRRVDIKNTPSRYSNKVHYIKRYNFRGELVMEATIVNGKLDSQYSYSHIYDAEGNWVIRYQTQKSDTLYTQYRKIEYYGLQ